jgi:hypothetical protein
MDGPNPSVGTYLERVTPGEATKRRGEAARADDSGGISTISTRSTSQYSKALLLSRTAPQRPAPALFALAREPRNDLARLTSTLSRPVGPGETDSAGCGSSPERPHRLPTRVIRPVARGSISTALGAERRMVHRFLASHTIYGWLSKLTTCGHDTRSPTICCGSRTCKLMW